MLVCLIALNARGLLWTQTMDVFWCEEISKRSSGKMPFGLLARLGVHYVDLIDIFKGFSALHLQL